MITEKHIIITGMSAISWKDAIVQTIAEVSKTIDYINTIKIIEQTAKVSGKKIVEYYVTIDLSFTVDRERED